MGERPGGSPGAPEEVPPPAGGGVTPRGVRGDPGQRRRNDTSPHDGHEAVEPPRSVGGRVETGDPRRERPLGVEQLPEPGGSR
jgi:hypothetical protein